MTLGTRAAALEDPSTYPPEPRKLCDVVMKGGVTSGVVYPQAVCELAKTFRFKNIGGTSAGAIAAAATAAAELGRRRRAPGGGFAEIAKLPAWLGEDRHLYALFQPQAQTEPLFRILVALTDQRHGGKLAALREALRGFKRWALVGALPGAFALALAGIAVSRASAPASAFGWLVASALGAAGGLLLVAGGLVGLAVGAYRRTSGAIPKNYYGICTGFSHSTVGGVPALTVWLTTLLNRLAGLDERGRPLTFGDLWGLDPALRESDPERWAEERARRTEDASRRETNLEMMTTCLTEARPYKFPLRTRTFYFHPDEFRAFFPQAVVDWIVAHPRATGPRDERADALAGAAGCRPLPEPADLPVVVATRMSLSVPPLISAVPLYAVDFSLPEDRQRAERSWFTDGGATSNFPVHFFDAPLPRWPTFGINLRPLRPGAALKPDECANVHMARTNSDGILQSWVRFDSTVDGESDARPGTPPRPGSLGGFFMAIIHTMQNWTDNLQIVQPGYRDRVVHVGLAGQEGGMNLKMDTGIVRRIAERGRCAGEMLRRRFATPEGDDTQLSWDNHRWLRYRRTLASLEGFLRSFNRGYENPLLGDRSYQDLIVRDEHSLPNSYRWDNRVQQEFAAQTTTQLVDLVRDWDRPRERGARAPSLRQSAPQPENPLRLVPPQ
ncbi:MAG: patatin-like phospholipase family protein [Chloroflexi bacterium]|nr:patatin-like phospholipase family protein [Chloroflexota bacterium]